MVHCSLWHMKNWRRFITSGENSRLTLDWSVTVCVCVCEHPCMCVWFTWICFSSRLNKNNSNSATVFRILVFLELLLSELRLKNTDICFGKLIVKCYCSCLWQSCFYFYFVRLSVRVSFICVALCQIAKLALLYPNSCLYKQVSRCVCIYNSQGLDIYWH